MSLLAAMDLKELWIGDQVRLLSSGRNGTFEGIAKDGRARVKVVGNFILTAATNLERYEETAKPPTITNSEEHKNGYDLDARESFKSEIDLHIDSLAPMLTNEAPQLIIRRQLLECRRYVQDAIQFGMKYITIIHGVGTGELKKEVEHLLSEYSEVRYTIPKHNGGATEVWLK